MKTAKTQKLQKKGSVCHEKLLRAAACLAAAAALHTIAAAQTPAFILREENGLIAYYDCADGTWTQTGWPAAALPNGCDRAALRCGLPLYSREALTRALEDHCS